MDKTTFTAEQKASATFIPDQYTIPNKRGFSDFGIYKDEFLPVLGGMVAIIESYSAVNGNLTLILKSAENPSLKRKARCKSAGFRTGPGGSESVAMLNAVAFACDNSVPVWLAGAAKPADAAEYSGGVAVISEAITGESVHYFCAMSAIQPFATKKQNPKQGF